MRDGMALMQRKSPIFPRSARKASIQFLRSTSYMNALLLGRLTQSLIWIGMFAAFWFLHGSYPDSEAILALLIAASFSALANTAILLVFRSQPMNMGERLTTLGGILARMYGHDDGRGGQ
jgi:hypothetical protein